MPKRILIIEDDQDILEILNIIFKDEGYEVVLSATGTEIIQIWDINPDIILLDIRLKDTYITGTEICYRLKAAPNTRNLPVILLSSEADLPRLSRQCGADAFVKKPFDIDVLSSKLKELTLHQY